MIIQKYKHPVVFYFLSTLIPWILWFVSAFLSNKYPSNQQVILLSSIFSFIGLLTPFIIALSLILPNKELKNDLLNRFFNFNNIKLKYLLITFFLMLISILVAQLISLLFGYSVNQFNLRGSYTFTSGVFPVWFMLLAAPFLEELAWHSYGTDCLRNRFSLFTTSILFAFFWGIWHLPLSFIKDYYHSNLVQSGFIYSINFLVSLFPFVIIMNWLYIKTNRNIFVTIVFHITAGFFNEIFATHPMSKVIQTGLLLVLSVYLLIKEKELFFIKNINEV